MHTIFVLHYVDISWQLCYNANPNDTKGFYLFTLNITFYIQYQNVFNSNELHK